MQTNFLLHLALFTMSSVCVADEVVEPVTVTFADDGLHKVIVEALTRRNLPTDPLTPEVLAKLNYLKAPSRGIESLVGLEHCNNLREVYLGHNKIVDLSPLSVCIKVGALDVSHNKITNAAALAKLTDLRMLNIDHNAIQELPSLSQLTRLGVLHVGHNQLKELAALDGLTSLHSLYASNNDISDISPLDSLPQLSNLDLRSNKVSDLAPLLTLKHLRWSFLADNEISDLAPLLQMIQANDKGAFASFCRFYLDGNPLGEKAMDQLKAIRSAGVSVSAKPKAAAKMLDDLGSEKEGSAESESETKAEKLETPND